MIRKSYADFVGGFADLNPFELDHLAEVMMVKLEEILADRGNAVMQFSLQDINFAMTRAMRDILVELAETQMADAECQLAKVHSRTFKPRQLKGAPATLVKRTESKEQA